MGLLSVVPVWFTQHGITIRECCVSSCADQSRHLSIPSSTCELIGSLEKQLFNKKMMTLRMVAAKKTISMQRQKQDLN